MSVEEDVGQILWLGFEGTSAPDWLLSAIGKGEVGSVILFKRNLEFRGDEVVIDQVRIGDQTYFLTLKWRPAEQGFEIIEIQ